MSLLGLGGVRAHGVSLIAVRFRVIGVPGMQVVVCPLCATTGALLRSAVAAH